MENREKLYMIITLLLLPPFTAEVLTGSTSLWSFINPLNLLILVCLYGLGTIIIRECWLKYSLKYGSIIILGFVYGIIEEGIAVKSFFNPAWKDLGVFGEYGRWIGVNWVWSIYLTVFHGVFSIFAPIILSEALYPSFSRRRLVKDRTLLLVLVVFGADILVINALTNYTISITNYLAMIIIATLLVIVALSIHYNLGKHHGMGAIKYALYWALWSTLFFICFYVVSAIISYPIIPFIMGIIIGITAVKLGDMLDKVNDNAILARYLSYTAIISPILFIDLIRASEPNYERMATLIIIFVFLLISYTKISKRRIYL